MEKSFRLVIILGFALMGNLSLMAANSKDKSSEKNTVIEYTVKPGDTLSSIIERSFDSKIYGTEGYIQRVLVLNGLVDKPDHIFTGQVLKLPAPLPSEKAPSNAHFTVHETAFELGEVVSKGIAAPANSPLVFTSPAQKVAEDAQQARSEQESSADRPAPTPTAAPSTTEVWATQAQSYVVGLVQKVQHAVQNNSTLAWQTLGGLALLVLLAAAGYLFRGRHKRRHRRTREAFQGTSSIPLQLQLSLKEDLMQSLENKLSQVSSGVIALEKKLAPLQHHISSLQGKVEGMDGQILQAQALFETMQAKVDPVDEKLAGLERMIELMQNMTLSMNKKLGPLDSSVVEVENKLRSLKSFVDNFAERAAPMEFQIQAFEKRISPVDSKLNFTEEFLKLVEEKITRIDGKIAPADQKLSKLERRIHLVNEMASTVESAVETSTKKNALQLVKKTGTDG